MTEKSNTKPEALPDLDDLLQCPVCYEIPSGQIFQCNEGHHVCGRCKMRLDVCPVCRAFFFGTRNYAMEELIANVQKLQAFKLGGKITTGTPPAEANTEKRDSSSEDNVSTNENEENEDANNQTSVRTAPAACKGLFRCLCCKNNPERLPAARLLNHLRYYHSSDLIEGRSENEEYVQAWQFPTTPGRIVTAVRVADMGIFFLIIEITDESVHSWMQMAAAPWVSNEFLYTFTLSGNDREAIFSDCVWSVRSCEGSLKKRGRCLSLSGADARALVGLSVVGGKLSLRRAPLNQLPGQSQPRVVLRVANRSRVHDQYQAALGLTLRTLRANVERLSQAVRSFPDEPRGSDESDIEIVESLARGTTASGVALNFTHRPPRSATVAVDSSRTEIVENRPRPNNRASAPRAAPAGATAARVTPAVTTPRTGSTASVRSQPAPARSAVPRSAPAVATVPRAAPTAGAPPRAAPAPTPAPRAVPAAAPCPATAVPAAQAARNNTEDQSHLSRAEARRLRQRVGLALASEEVPEPRGRATHVSQNERNLNTTRTLNNSRSSGDTTVATRGQNGSAPERAPGGQQSNRYVTNNSSRAPNNQCSRLQNISTTARPNSGVVNSSPVTANVRNNSPSPVVAQVGYLQVVDMPTPPPPSISGSAQTTVTNGNNSRNKRRRRNRR